MAVKDDDSITQDSGCFVKDKYTVKMLRVGKVLLWTISFVMIYAFAMFVGGNDFGLLLAYLAMFAYKGFLGLVLIAVVAAWVIG